MDSEEDYLLAKSIVHSGLSDDEWDTLREGKGEWSTDNLRWKSYQKYNLDELKEMMKMYKNGKVNLHKFAKALDELRQRIIDKETFFPARFQENTKRATAAVLNAAGPNVKDQYVGIAFFVSPTRLVTTQHILASNYAGFVEGCVIRIGVHAAEGGVCIQDAFLVRSAIEWDLAVLTIESPHHSHLHLPTSIASSNGQKLAIISFTSHLSDLAPNAVDNSFCLIPGNLVKINGHHVVYSTELFNGDSGGAVILSSDGTAVALHQKSVNQAIELARVGGVDDDDDYDDLSGIKIDDEKYYEHVSKKMRGISKTLNSLVTGLSQGFIGLRLDCKDIQDFIFQ